MITSGKVAISFHFYCRGSFSGFRGIAVLTCVKVVEFAICLVGTSVCLVFSVKTVNAELIENHKRRAH